MRLYKFIKLKTFHLALYFENVKYDALFISIKLKISMLISKNMKKKMKNLIKKVLNYLESIHNLEILTALNVKNL